MTTATLRFRLPRDRAEVVTAQAAPDLAAIVRAVESQLRDWRKYGVPDGTDGESVVDAIATTVADHMTGIAREALDE